LKITDIDRRIADLVAINPRPHQPSALVSMGRDMLARDVEAATKCFDKALSIDPRHVPAWIARSDALCLTGRKGQAVGCLERAIDVEPNNAELAERKSKLLAELAVASSRNRRFDPPSSQSPIAKAPPSSSRMIVKEEMAAKEIETAPEPAAPAPPPPPLAPAPEPNEPIEPRFDVELDVKPKPQPPSDPNPAPVSEPKPEAPSSDPLDQAAALLASGKAIEALRRVEPLSKQPDAGIDVWMLRGRICAALDQRDAEIASYEKATKLDPKSVPAWLALAVARVWLKRLERALDAADQALLLAPFDGNVQKLRGVILMGLMQGSAAVAAFEKATQHAPDDAEAWLELGRALRSVRKPDAARDALRRALGIAETMDPGLVPAVKEQLEKLR
jgi:tetratricopeptide (TPR) repeat protein